MAAFGPVSPIKSHDMAVEHAASDRLMAVPGRGYHNHVAGHDFGFAVYSAKEFLGLPGYVVV